MQSSNMSLLLIKNTVLEDLLIASTVDPGGGSDLGRNPEERGDSRSRQQAGGSWVSGCGGLVGILVFLFPIV